MFNTAFSDRLAHKSIFSLFFAGLVKLSSLIKVSFIIGSYTAFFSMTSVMMPLSGMCGPLMAILISALGISFKLAIGSSLTLKFLAYHVPGLFAALYWSTDGFFTRILVPFACVLAFICNPVGYQIWAYSLFWLIPMAIGLLKKKPLFLQALGSTLTAHAVGTAIWIWAVPTTPAFWLMLVPVVIIERIVFALGSVIMYKVLNYSFKAMKKQARFTAFIALK